MWRFTTDRTNVYDPAAFLHIVIDAQITDANLPQRQNIFERQYAFFNVQVLTIPRFNERLIQQLLIDRRRDAVLIESAKRSYVVDRGFRQRNLKSSLRHTANRLIDYPTLPSKLTPNSFCASTANSIGNSRKTSLQKPLTIMLIASSKLIPRVLQ